MKITVHTSSRGYYLPVRVNGITVKTENPRIKNWPKHDPNPQNCKGRGQARCLQQGEHSWFNHSQDHMSSHNNLPPDVLAQPNLHREII